MEEWQDGRVLGGEPRVCVPRSPSATAQWGRVSPCPWPCPAMLPWLQHSEALVTPARALTPSGLERLADSHGCPLLSAVPAHLSLPAVPAKTLTGTGSSLLFPTTCLLEKMSWTWAGGFLPMDVKGTIFVPGFPIYGRTLRSLQPAPPLGRKYSELASLSLLQGDSKGGGKP